MSRAPLSEVLGPVPVWAMAAISAALAVERLAPTSARSGSIPSGSPRPAWVLLLERLPAGTVVGLVATVVGVVVLLVVAWRCREATAPLAAGVLAVAVVATCVGTGFALRDDGLAAGVLPALADRGGRLALEATVVAEPRPIATGWHVLVRVERAGDVDVRERAALTWDEEPPALGERWAVVASARPIPDGGYGRWLVQQHARVVLDVHEHTALGPGGPGARTTEWLRARVRAAATSHLDVPTGGLLVGFVTGDTRLLPAEDREAMQATSLTHLTAVSGTNVAIVIGGVIALATLLRSPLALQRLAVAAVVPWFAFLTRFEPSVLRAGSMALLLLFVSTRGQVRDARHALAVAVLFLVLLDPRLAGSLGLLLSATATAGVLLVAPVVRDRLPARLPRRAATLVGVTVGAQIAVLPLLLVTFGELSLASVPANLLAVPAAMLAATLSFVATALAVLHPAPAAVVFALAGPGAAIVLAVARGLSGWGGVIELARPATVIASVAAIVWLLSAGRRGPARVAAVVLVVALVAALLPSVVAGGRPDGMRVTAIDVGQGDAFLIESPGARVLVDAGEDGTAARWLRQHGRRHLDLVVVTHPHLDHIGGVPEVLRLVSVGAVWASPLPTELPEAAETWQVAADRGVPVRAPIAGNTVVLGDLVIEILHPPPGRPYRFARSELNESSTVLRFHHDGARLLATGDVEAEAQADLMAAVPDSLAAEVLLVPHHGSATTDPSFLVAVAPEVAIISAGRDNRHGHPHPDIVAALESLGARVRRTDLVGTLTVTVPRAAVPAATSTCAVCHPHPPVPVASRGRDAALARSTRLGSAPARRRRALSAKKDAVHGRFPDVPEDDDADPHPGVLLAGGAGRPGCRCGELHPGGGPDRPRPHHPRADRGAGLRGAADRAVPHPLLAAAHGPHDGGPARPRSVTRTVRSRGPTAGWRLQRPRWSRPAHAARRPAAGSLTAAVSGTAVLRR